MSLRRLIRRLRNRCETCGHKLTTVHRLPNNVYWIGLPHCSFDKYHEHLTKEIAR